MYEGLNDDETYYSWRVHCSEAEFEADGFAETMGVINTSTSRCFERSLVEYELRSAIHIALNTPVVEEKVKFYVGDEVYFSQETRSPFCYVVDVINDGKALNLYNTQTHTTFTVSDNEAIKQIKVSGHSEMAEKLFA